MSSKQAPIHSGFDQLEFLRQLELTPGQVSFRASASEIVSEMMADADKHLRRAIADCL